MWIHSRDITSRERCLHAAETVLKPLLCPCICANTRLFPVSALTECIEIFIRNWIWDWSVRRRETQPDKTSKDTIMFAYVSLKGFTVKQVHHSQVFCGLARFTKPKTPGIGQIRTSSAHPWKCMQWSLHHTVWADVNARGGCCSAITDSADHWQCLGFIQ